MLLQFLSVCPSQKADRAQDSRLSLRMKLLQFLGPEMFDVKPSLYNDVVVAIAQEELRRINSYVAPGDKLNCVIRAAKVEAKRKIKRDYYALVALLGLRVFTNS